MSKKVEDRQFWAGFSEKLGIVIYDPKLSCHPFQRKQLDEDSVVLWLVNPGRREVFKKVEAREKLTPLLKHLCAPPQSMTEEEARYKADGIRSDYYVFLIGEEEFEKDKLEDDCHDHLGDRDGELEHRMHVSEMHADQDDFERDNEEGWSYED